ncbi:hypothetical protein NDU88_005431 [Pleurodeles waltl]|uniref:Uncharacterized protein n=1 Tax=Pleurodeles waltl TaxID=8319 RepID=A0AAV7L2C5_PLEWA|nr:hypothetical protein NDU88_005431 [Pleurodeles waltl]
MLLSTYEDMDLTTEWCESTEECSVRLMKTLIKHAKRKTELQSLKIELLIRQLEKTREEQGVKDQLEKIEKRLQEYEAECMDRKSRKFTRHKLDYQYGRVYLLGKSTDYRQKREWNCPIMEQSESELSSDPGSSADESHGDKGDFQNELRLLRMNMRRGRGREQWQCRMRRGKRKKTGAEVRKFGVINLVDSPSLVVNILSIVLTSKQEIILDLGLSFCPTTALDSTGIRITLYKYIRKMKLHKYHLTKPKRMVLEGRPAVIPSKLKLADIPKTVDMYELVDVGSHP